MVSHMNNYVFETAPERVQKYNLGTGITIPHVLQALVSIIEVYTKVDNFSLKLFLFMDNDLISLSDI